MAIIPTSAERAQSSVTKAEAAVSEWTTKAAAARADAVELDATAGAAILADESAAERITLRVQTLERKARAYDQAAAEAGKNLNAARLAALTAEAAESDKAQAAAMKRLDKHEAAVKDLLDKLEELEGVEYVQYELPPLQPGESRTVRVPTSDLISNEAYRHRVNAIGIRYFLKTGQAGSETGVINRALGTDLYPGQIGVPDSVAAAIAAGVTVAAA